jgi:hypothetical protein
MLDTQPTPNSVSHRTYNGDEDTGHTTHPSPPHPTPPHLSLACRTEMSSKRKYDSDNDSDSDDNSDSDSGWNNSGWNNAKRLRRDEGSSHCAGPCSCPTNDNNEYDNDEYQDEDDEYQDEDEEEYNSEDLDEAEIVLSREYSRDAEGYDCYGFDPDGWDENGFNEDGLDEYGFNEDGLDQNGYDEDGYDCNGFDPNGFDPDGYDQEGHAGFCERCGEDHDTERCHLYRSTTYSPCMICRKGLLHFSQVCQS